MVSASTCSRTMFSLDSCKKCNSKVRKFKIFKNKSQTVKGTSVNTSSISIMRIVVLLLMILTETSSKVTSTSTSKMLLLWPRFVCVLVPSFIHLRPCPTIFIPTTLYVFTFKNAKIWSRILWAIVWISIGINIGVLIFQIINNTQTVKPSQCIQVLQINNYLVGPNSVSVNVIALCYMLPLINFLFLSFSPYTIPMQ